MPWGLNLSCATFHSGLHILIQYLLLPQTPGENSKISFWSRRSCQSWFVLVAYWEVKTSKCVSWGFTHSVFQITMLLFFFLCFPITPRSEIYGLNNCHRLCVHVWASGCVHSHVDCELSGHCQLSIDDPQEHWWWKISKVSIVIYMRTWVSHLFCSCYDHITLKLVTQVKVFQM